MEDLKNLKEFHISDAEVMGDLKALMGEIQREEQGDRPPSYDSLHAMSSVEEKKKRLLKLKQKALALKRKGEMDKCKNMIRNEIKPLKAEIESLREDDIADDPELLAQLGAQLKAMGGEGKIKDHDDEGDIVVTEEDMNDPELLAQLKARGGDDDNEQQQQQQQQQQTLTEQIETKEKQLLEAKRKALTLKKAKRMDECVQIIRDVVKPLKAEIELLKSKQKNSESKEIKEKKDGKDVEKLSTVEKRLYAFYKYWEPSRLSDSTFLKRTIKRYENKLPQLISDLQKKYGPEPSTIASQLKDREAEYLKEAMSLRKSGDKKQCQIVLVEADKLRLARESVESGKKINLTILPGDMSERRKKSNLAKRKHTIVKIKSLLASEIKRTRSKEKRAAMMSDLRKMKALESNISVALPSYRVETVTETVPVVQSDVPEDGIQVNIVRATDVKTGGSSYVEFDLDFPREKQHVGKTQVTKLADWNYIKIFEGALKLKGGDRGLARRDRKILRSKAVFTLWREGGFFSSAVAIGRAIVPLKLLMNKSKIAVKVPMIAMKTRKKIGGTMTIIIRIREALKGSETEKVDSQHLVIDWSSTTSTSPSLDNDNVSQKTTTTTTRKTTNKIGNSKLDPKWIKDPHNIQLIPSYECLKDELIISNKLLEASRKRNADVDTIMILETRSMVIQGKISIIERDYAAGKLTPDAYFPLLQSAMSRDRQLALYFKQNNRKNDAVRCVRRYKTMIKEIKDLKAKFS